ncbi:MAG: phosphatidylserine decarboxylase [Lentisphaerae bacterium]|nr:phosphatidylserine decarboxylase [Lentisphaerota bacterium]
MSKAKPIQYIDRASGKTCTESVMGNKALNFAYNTLLGRSLWGLLFNTGFLSRLMGWFYDSKLSHNSIKSLLAIPGLNAGEAEKDWHEYRSFNDFFTRKLKNGARPAAVGNDVLCSPADGRLLIYPDVEKDVKIPVKGAVRSLESLCAMELPAQKYSVAVIRLAPIDYHRYHYPCDCNDDGKMIKVKGKYHSVNPIAFAKAPDLFVENTKVVTPLCSPVFGKFFFLEVGAFGVGSIVNTAVAGKHEKLDEKGFFKFGGSTVILVMDAEKIKFDPDLIRNSANKVEMLVRCGEKIGIAK